MKSKSDFFFKVVSTSIAICAFSLSIHNALRTSYHQKLNSTPALMFSAHHKSGEYGTGISIKNNGLGPAVIDSMAVFYHDELRSGMDGFNGLDSLLIEHDIPTEGTYIHALRPGAYIQVGEEYKIWGLNAKGLEIEGLNEKFINLLNDTRVYVRYSSIYEVESESLSPVFDPEITKESFTKNVLGRPLMDAKPCYYEFFGYCLEGLFD